MSTLNFPWRGPVVKKKPPYFNARALISPEITRSTASAKHRLYFRLKERFLEIM